MVRYFVKRILQMIPLLLVVSFIVFMFIRLIPGDPARLMAGPDATVEEVEFRRQQYGLDKPLLEQYVDYMVNLFHGDLGTSLRSGRPVTEVLLPRYQPTIMLAISSIIWALIVGLLLGTVSGVFRGKWPDHFGMLIAIAGISVPSFWLGLMLIQKFAIDTPIFNATGLNSLKDLVLPSITLGAGIMAMIARNTRSEMVETMSQDYIRTARAKGLGEGAIVTKHALRNSLVQVMTVVGLQFGFLLGGSVVVERVFAISGLGSLLVDSIANRDYTVIQAELLIFSFAFIFINLIVDIAYGLVNPKIRLS